jgi:hypothetical protein
LRGKMRQKIRQDTLRILQHVRIPVSNDTKSSCLQASVSEPVRLRIRVLPTVDLDDKSSLEADKINNGGPERNLSAEFDAFEPTVAQQEPNLALGKGLGSVAWRARSCAAVIVRTDDSECAARTPHPHGAC